MPFIETDNHNNILGRMVRGTKYSEPNLTFSSSAWSAGVDKLKFVTRMISFFLYWCSQTVSNKDVLPQERE